MLTYNIIVLLQHFNLTKKCISNLTCFNYDTISLNSMGPNYFGTPVYHVVESRDLREATRQQPAVKRRSLTFFHTNLLSCFSCESSLLVLFPLYRPASSWWLV